METYNIYDYMTREEVYAKYGPPLRPLGQKPRGQSYIDIGKQIREEKRKTKPFPFNQDRYLELKEEGKTDKEICKEFHLRQTRLYEAKRAWGIQGRIRR